MGLFDLFSTTKNYQQIYCDELEEKLEKERRTEYELLDVRTLAEFKSGHIPGAKHFDMMDPSFLKRIEKLDKDKTYYVYCRSGSRSATVCREMGNMGFKNLYNLAGGLIGWGGKISHKS